MSPSVSTNEHPPYSKFMTVQFILFFVGCHCHQSTGTSENSGYIAESLSNKQKFSRKNIQFLYQVLIRLCSHAAAVEELARKDDLTLLFSAISSACPPHNACWRKTSSDVLLTVSRHALSQPVISYLHNKGCIAMCIGTIETVGTSKAFSL